MDTIFDENNLVQPDILFIAVSRYYIIEQGKINTAPDLIVEIWLPANKKKERNAKHNLYEKNKITGYWQIFPKTKKVTIETINEERQYEIFAKASKKGIIQSKILEGFSVDIEDLFEILEVK